VTSSPDASPSLNPKSAATYDLLMRRRSVLAKTMTGPAPNRETVEKIITAGMRVPDHGKLAPWRFLVLEDAQQQALNTVINAAIEASDDPKAPKAWDYASQGPLLVIAIYSPSDSRPIPEWEQMLSAGAVCQNILIAATALGVASQWLTGWPSYQEPVAAALGLSEREKIAGLIFLGQQEGTVKDRDRPTLADKLIWHPVIG